MLALLCSITVVHNVVYRLKNNVEANSMDYNYVFLSCFLWGMLYYFTH